MGVDEQSGVSFQQMIVSHDLRRGMALGFASRPLHARACRIATVASSARLLGVFGAV